MKILFIVGSLRKGSFNRILADEAMKALEGKAEVRWLDYSKLPMFNADHAYPFDEYAQVVRQTIYGADALWIFCPEYNGSFTGALKNVLDYASLAMVKDDFSSGTPLMHKPVAQAGAGGKFATSRAEAALTKLLEQCQCRVMTSDITEIALPASAFSTGEWTPSQEDIEKITDEANAFLKFIEQPA